VDVAPQVLPLEDPDMAAVVQDRLEAEGAAFHLGARLLRVQKAGGVKRVVFVDSSGQERTLEAEQILLAVGRKGNTEGLEAQKAGLQVKGGFFASSPSLATSRRHILAIGDCNGRYLFTHVAGAEGALAVRHTVLRLPVRMDYSRVPWVTYTDPELASVGYNEKRAREAGVPYTAVEAPFAEVDRARIESEAEGKVKILIDRKGRVIGCQLAGAHAGELLLPAVLAVRRRLKLMELMSAMAPYPTMSESYKKAAGAYFAPRVYNPRIRRLLRLVFGYGGGRG
jgi:pyruvate/2-oxoglutarate dehydrogenase complex dihydrolipoamide dehydrogenase (E3) component